MIFSDFTYERPDLNQYETTFNAANKHFSEASSYSDAKTALQELNRLRGDMAKNMKLAYIRHSIDTSDNFYRDENDFGTIMNR